MPSRHGMSPAEIGKYTRSQAGVVSRTQLLMIGCTDAFIRSNIAAGRWSRLLPGVFNTVTGAPSFHAWWWATHLWAGDDSDLHGATALQAWGLMRPNWPIVIAVPAYRQIRTRAENVEVVRLRQMRPVRFPTGCPATESIEHALLDLASHMKGEHEVMSLLTSVCQKQPATIRKLSAALKGRRRIGHRVLMTEIISEVKDGATTMLEIPAIRRIFRAHGLPSGRGQVREFQEGAVVVRDRVFEQYGLVVEFDGRLGHADSRGRFRDHRRDNAVAISGRATLRFGWVDVHREACESAAQVVKVLRLRGWAGTPTLCGPSCRIRIGS